MDNSIINLIKMYVDEYNNQEHPFLLFDPAHVNENDHTRVLLSILKLNKYQFLPSFLQTIDAPEYNTIVEAPTDQKPAIGNKGKGFIDLYFKYTSTNGDEEKFIIENKIYGAGDTERQLARYIATVIPNKSNDDFDEIWNSWNNPDREFYQKVNVFDFEHIHVVYLTADGSKKPSLKSLPKYFGNRYNDDSEFDEGKMRINYYPVNYADDIIPWLENDVLPNMPYSDNGIAIAGIRQYIASLKSMFSDKSVSEVVMTFVGKEPNDDTYNKIDSVISNLRNRKGKKKDMDEINGYDVDCLILQPLIRDLGTAFNKLYSFSDNGWQFYFTPSFVLLFKDSWWSESDIKKGYNFPSIHINCSPTKNFFETDKCITCRIKADHLPKNTNVVDLNDNWQFEGNRNRTISKILLKDISRKRDNDYNEFIKQIVKELDAKEEIKKLDDIIKEAKETKKSYQETILEKAYQK